MQAAADLLSWYRAEGRDLPWRRNPNPYRVWVSEVMLQQTTVAVAGPYFTRFVKRYPTLGTLARAREDDVLALWSGLGYYHRARNMLAAAQLVVTKHRGRIPRDYAALRALPGVGPYTAGAILSIGHGLRHPALDGNVIRVIARLAGIEQDTSRAATRRLIEARVIDLMPAGEAAGFNQALMDLGATLCVPREPRCGACPVARCCAAHRMRATDRIPKLVPRREPVPVELVAVAVRSGADCLLVRRDAGRLMGGMWEFPSRESAAAELCSQRLARRLRAGRPRRVGSVRHTVTHHRIRIDVYQATTAARRRQDSGQRWACLEEVAEGRYRLPVTGSARKIARLLAEQNR